MPNPAIGVAALSAGSGLLKSRAQSKAAERAAGAEVAANQAAIAEERRQFDISMAKQEEQLAQARELLRPFASGGTGAYGQMMALSGASGADQERAAIAQVQASPQYQEALRAGQESILSQASATGGLRGGNVQGALGQLAPAILNDTISQRYSQLGGLAQLGQASAAGSAATGVNVGANIGAGAQRLGETIGARFGEIGAAQAGAALGRGSAALTGIGGITRGLGYGLGQLDQAIPEGETIFSRWGF